MTYIIIILTLLGFIAPPDARQIDAKLQKQIIRIIKEAEK